MPTVPPWISHAIVVIPSRSRTSPDDACPIKDWRATKTQVVVTLDNPNRSEMRFYLDGLRAVGARYGEPELLDADAPETVRRVARIRSARAIADLETAMALNVIAHNRNDPEALVTEIGRIQRAATEALARLADLL